LHRVLRRCDQRAVHGENLTRNRHVSSAPSPGATSAAASAISAPAVQRCAEEAGYSVVTDFTGHGIGTAMHEPPDVLDYGTHGRGLRLRAGMMLAIEPMVNAGGPEVRVLATSGQWLPTTSASLRISSTPSP
jgi:methionine aminopeptidase